MKSRIYPAIAAILFLLTSPAHATSVTEFDSKRPVQVRTIPATAQPAPLLIGLHSAGMSGDHFEGKAKLTTSAKAAGWIYITPSGTFGGDGRRVWNAAKSCCQHGGEPVDDIAYINSVIDWVKKIHAVDESRIYLVGTSNGAFMSYTYACATGRVRAVVALAGALDTDFTCASKKNFAVLAIHGTSDSVIKYKGGSHAGHSYTSAEATTSFFAQRNKCSKILSAALQTFDFDPRIPGPETRVMSYEKCTSPVVQWDITRGKHSPTYPKNFAELVTSFLKNPK